MPGIVWIQTFITFTLLGLICAQIQITQVQVLFRHGDRTPLLKELYPNDIHGNSVYKAWGLGQLTNAGKMREYRIGQVLKERYQKLLGTLYLPEMVYAFSTDTDRTKMSLQLVLAGLFPPSEVQTWNPDLPWIPMPIHYLPKQIDILLNSHRCPQYLNKLAEAEQLPEFKANIATFNNFFEFLSSKTGTNISTINDIFRIGCLLESQIRMNLSLPEWCTYPTLQRIKEGMILSMQIKSYTTDLKRLITGPIIRKLIENMRLDGDARNNSRKIYLYSSHDMNVFNFLRAHGILEPKLPLFGTAVMLEKLEDDNGNRFVKLILWTGVTEQLITLRLPGCEEVCPVERYLQLTREVIPTDEEMDCHWRRLSTKELRNSIEDN